MRTILIIGLCFFLLFNIVGCSGKKEGTAGGKEPAASATTSQKPGSMMRGMQKISDNPAFFGARAITAKLSDAIEIDSRLQPVLKQFFEDANLIKESGPEESKNPENVVENRLFYKVRMMVIPSEGKAFHAALLNAGFKVSPRLGRQAQTGSGGSYMSLFLETPKHKYSLVINIDTRKQEIEVVSYKLGSKYDRWI